MGRSDYMLGRRRSHGNRARVARRVPGAYRAAGQALPLTYAGRVTSKLFKGLDPWNPTAAFREVVSHVMLAGFAIVAGLGYLGLMLVFVAELVLGNLVSAALYPERGLRRHLWDLLKFLGAMGFLLVFVFATYSAASGTKLDDAGLWKNLGVGMGAVKAAVAFAAVHVAVLYALARRAKDPRVAWAKSVLMQNGATLVMLFFIIFIAVFAAPLLIGAAYLVGVEASPDRVLIVLAAAVRLFFALLLTRMPERELLDIARAPYID